MGATTLTMEQFDELLTEKIRKALEPLTAVDRKAGILPTDAEEDLEKMTPQERSVRFLKAVFFGKSNDPVLLQQRALSEGTDSAGGYLVPDEFRSEIIRVAHQYGIARKYLRNFPMKRQKMNVPTAGATGVTAYWINEASQITESTPNFGQVQLDANQLAGIAALTNQLVADADVDVLGYLYQIFGEAIAKAEDTAWLTGTGSPITGLLGSTSVNVVTMGSGDTAFSNISADDLLDLIDAVDSDTETNAMFFFHKNILTYLRKLKDSNGQYILTPPTAGAPGTLWGYPYVVTSVMPSSGDSAISTKFVAFGSGDYSIFGDRQQMEVAMATEGTIGSNNLFEKNMQALRVIERVDIQIAVPTAYSVLQTAAS